jgi:hypothetical protein
MRPNLDDGRLVYAHAFLTQRVHNDVDRQRVLLFTGRSCHARGVREEQDTRLWRGREGRRTGGGGCTGGSPGRRPTARYLHSFISDIHDELVRQQRYGADAALVGGVEATLA